MKASKLYFIIVAALVVLNTHAFAQSKPKSNKTVRFAAIPIITYNRTQGAVIGANTSVYYKLNKKDTISPHSNTGLIGIYTVQKSWVIGFNQTLYFNEDRWRSKINIYRGAINFQYYDWDDVANVGGFEDYSNQSTVAKGQLQHKVWKRWYAGLYGAYNYTKTYFTSHNDSLDVRRMSNMGYVISNDSRNNVQFPSRGVFLNYLHQFYRDWTGSDNNFTKLKIVYNQFFDLLKDQRHVLVARATMNIATGDVPFQGQSVVGSDDIRGYSQGQYRGNQVYAVQSEYRWMFNRSKFGVVGFFGIASAVESFSDIFKSPLLPGGGAGVRFRAIPSLKVNIGVDVGFGKNDYSLTFRIGEAFSR